MLKMVTISAEDLQQLEDLTQLVFPGEKINEVVRLGGLTNHTYAVSLGQGRYIFRLPGEGTEALINRHDEKVSNELADRLGIDAQLVYFDAHTGKKVSAYLEDATTMSPQSMQEEHNIIDAACLFRTLHSCGVNTEIPFKVFDMAERYEKIILANGIALYDDYPHVHNAVMAIKNKMDELTIEEVPCHNDPLCENWVRDPRRIYLIDWEYAGMNDPLWDLADVSIEADYSPTMDELLLRTYFGAQPDSSQSFRFVANKIYLDFLWSLWGKTRVPYDGDEMEEYALNRYLRLKKNLVALPAYDL